MYGIQRLSTVVATIAWVASPAPAQDVMTVPGREYREAIDLAGATVTGYQTTEIRAKLGGYVKVVGTTNGEEIDVGSRVKSGAMLAELDIPEMHDDLAEQSALVEQSQSEVLQADAAIAEAEAVVAQKEAAFLQVKSRTAEKQAMLKLSQAKLKRLSRLAGSGTIGQENLDEAKFEVDASQAVLQSVQADVRAATSNIEAAQAGVRTANADKVSAEAHVRVAQATMERLKTTMNYTIIRAPYDGVITKRMVDLGSFVQPAQNNSAAMPVFEITQIDKVRLIVAVPNNHVAKVEPGQSAIFHSIGGLEGRAFEGKVTRSAGALDPKTRTMRIEIHLDNPATDTISGDKVELKPGLYGTLTIVRKQWNSDNLLPVVPTTAVGRDENGNRFVMAVENGRPIRRTVEVAFNDASSIGISRGLRVGDNVLRDAGSR